MLRFPNLVGAALFAIGASASAFAQTAQTTQPPPAGAPQTNSGLGPPATNPTQVDKGQNMILPSAGQAGQSAAPTMVYDCKAKPQDCITPATPADKATAPDASATPATPKP
jgi:hypothetical protein